MPRYQSYGYYPLNQNLRVVAVSTTTFIPRLNYNLTGCCDYNGTALPGAAGLPFMHVIARNNPDRILLSMNSGVSVPMGYYSTNGGNTFTAIPATGSFVLGSAISDNGQFMAVAKANVNSALRYTYNGGTTWSSTPIVNNATGSVCCSSDGSKVFIGPTNTAGAPTNVAYISTNSMATLTTLTLPSSGWYGACMTANGSRIWISRFNNNIAPKTVSYSDNNGGTWTSVTVDAAAISTGVGIKCSANGQHLIMGHNNADVYISNNFGATWTKKTMSENVYWVGVNISSSGQYMVVPSTVTNGRFFYSEDYGATWRPKTMNASTTQFRGICIEEL